MAYLNNTVSSWWSLSTNSLGGIAPGKVSSGPGERHKVRSAIFSRQARSMRVEFFGCENLAFRFLHPLIPFILEIHQYAMAIATHANALA
jgi:hypothetical protein